MAWLDATETFGNIKSSRLDLTIGNVFFFQKTK